MGVFVPKMWHPHILYFNNQDCYIDSSRGALPHLLQLPDPVLPPPCHLDPVPGGVLGNEPGDEGSV